MRIRDASISMFVQRQYQMNNNALGKIMMQLSSGYRINSAADDAAGLAISEGMRAQIRGLNSAARNTQMAMSMLQTAEGAMDSIHSMLQRMNELAVQASTGTNADIDRNALNKEFLQLKAEIADTAMQADFNGLKIFGGDYSLENGGMAIQTGALEGQQTTIYMANISLQRLGLTDIDLSTQENASKAITAVKSAIYTVADERATLGAMSNRFQYKLDNLKNTALNLTEAESRIRDTDMAAAMTEFARLSIQQQAIMAMMVQCNSSAQRILQLFDSLR